MFQIRLAPSGAPVAVVGTGMQLRMVEARSSVDTGVQLIPTDPATVGFVLGVAPALELGFFTFGGTPVTAMRYRATMVMDVGNSGEGTSLVQLDLQVDWGDGLGFVSAGLSTHVVPAGVTRQLRVDATPLTPPAHATKAVFRAVISNDVDDSHLNLVSKPTGPTIDFQVQELLA